MSAMFCLICGIEMVSEQRVLGDPALDCGGDCAGCLDEIENHTYMDEHRERRVPPKRTISRRDYPDIYDVLAEVYGRTTAPMPSMPNRVEATDLLPLAYTPDGTPI